MVRLVREARRLLPGVGIQVPPNLSDWWPELVRAGATDLGGLSANGDHISPEHPFPSPAQVRRRLPDVALSERLCVYPQFIDDEWLSPRVLEVIRAHHRTFVPRVHEAVDFGATEICMQSGIHPDWDLEDYLGWLRLAKETAPQIHLHAYSPMEVAHMCDVSGLPPADVFARLVDAGLGSTPGTAAEVLHDGVRERISPNKLPVGRWIEIIEASHRAGLRSTSTVMFGHVEEPRELARHMRAIRELQERTGGITEFVPLSFVPFQTLLGRTHGIEPISPEENLKHTAVFRLALGHTIPNVQASWVKMGLEVATEALRWGVNDLGGTLMEESISRLAGSYHGVKLDPPQLIAAAHAAGRPAAERTTPYELRRPYPVGIAA